jgi:hypothetical protein
MDYRMIGVMETIVTDVFHKRSAGDDVGAAFMTFKTLPSILSHYSSTPTLHYSINPGI